MKTPDERALPDVTQEDWDIVVPHLKYVYVRLRAFGAKTLGRKVDWKGPIGQHQWIVSGGLAYGVDPVGIMEDLEYRAIEAAVTAVHDFDANAGITLLSFMAMRINSKLASEFEGIVHGEPEMISLSDVSESELSYLEEWDRPDDGLDEATSAKLQAAMGTLTSREAWALRMHADGVPNAVIAENLNLKGEKSVFKIIADAKRKAQEAYGD